MNERDVLRGISRTNLSGVHIQTNPSVAASIGEPVRAEVIALRCLARLELETIVASVRRINRAVVVREAWKSGGFSLRRRFELTDGAGSNCCSAGSNCCTAT